MLRKKEICAIFGQGVEAVATTIRQLYEMIEADDERVHRLVSSATCDGDDQEPDGGQDHHAGAALLDNTKLHLTRTK